MARSIDTLSKEWAYGLGISDWQNADTRTRRKGKEVCPFRPDTVHRMFWEYGWSGRSINGTTVQEVVGRG